MTKKEDPIRQLKADVQQGKTKHEAFNRYLAENGEAIRGSMTLAMIPDESDLEKNRWLKVGMLAMYWVPIMGLYIASALQGNFAVFFGHFLWPTLVTILVIRNSAFGYYFFLYIVAHEIYVAFNSNIENAWFLPLTVIYCLAILGLTVFTKLRMYPYQSFFHQTKNPDRTFVFSSSSDLKEKPTFKRNTGKKKRKRS
jgi:hypothetical protein